MLVAVYGLFALAATARSAVQIATKFHEAPLAYLLSAFAAVVYIVATVSLARGDAASRRVATVAISLELAGVVIVGAVSELASDAFPHATVWGLAAATGSCPSCCHSSACGGCATRADQAGPRPGPRQSRS